VSCRRGRLTGSGNRGGRLTGLAGALLAAVLAFQAWAPAHAFAHGTTYDVLDSAATVAARFAYDDGEPMMYAEVLVFRPGDDDIEYQNGRTDRLGHFAFRPDTAGTWRVEVSDGMGHKVEADIQVDADLAGAAAVGDRGRRPASVGLRVVTGLSLLANLGLLGLLRRRRTPATPSAREP